MTARDQEEALEVKAWLKDVAPSPALRKWFAHEPAKWQEFQRCYRTELESNPEASQPILETAKQGDVTLLYSTRDTEHNGRLAQGVSGRAFVGASLPDGFAPLASVRRQSVRRP